jgi:hypothetical protein
MGTYPQAILGPIEIAGGVGLGAAPDGFWLLADEMRWDLQGQAVTVAACTNRTVVRCRSRCRCRYCISGGLHRSASYS